MSGIYSLTQLSILETCALLGWPGVCYVDFSSCMVALEILGHICLPHESIAFPWTSCEKSGSPQGLLPVRRGTGGLPIDLSPELNTI